MVSTHPRHEAKQSVLMVLLVGTFLGAAQAAGNAELPADAAGNIARQTVAASLGSDVATPKVVLVTPRDFPDGSLGCPEAGMLYPQVITPGFEVKVEVDGRPFDVRVSGSRGRICRSAGQPGRPVNVTPTEAAEPARQDLAIRLGVLATDVRITTARAQRPGEHLPGCAETCDGPGACGFVLVLEVGGRAYDYLSIAGAVKPCPAIEAR